MIEKFYVELNKVVGCRLMFVEDEEESLRKGAVFYVANK